MSIPRVPVGGRASLSPQTSSNPFSTMSTPGTLSPSKPLLSPGWREQDRETDTAQEPEPVELDPQAKTPSFREDLDISFGEISPDPERRMANNGNDNDNDTIRLLDGCPTKHDIHSSRASWLSISVLLLSIYSTFFSGMWFILAIVQPRYGRRIVTGGTLSPSTASTVFALFAKTIELSFVTVFITFLGQVLSRRSLIKGSRGVTISEMTMRTWVIQPGFMITHWENLKHAGFSFLGAIALTAAFVAMFYTTASDSLVSPHLKFGRWESTQLQGLVQASYANPIYIKQNCRNPISVADDPDTGESCLTLEHAGQAYHNAITFLNSWADIKVGGEGTQDLSMRPRALAMLYDNTTVAGSWVLTNTSNIRAAYEKYNRVVNNISLAMPHAGVASAAQDDKNNILQPKDLEGVGEYSVKASVVSPTVNVLCVNLNKEELAPIIYTEWPNAQKNTTDFPGQYIPWIGWDTQESNLAPGKFVNSTVVDDIFEWGPKYDRQAPVFPMYPIDYNSVGNITVSPSDSAYLLIKSPDTPDYTVCQLRSFLSPNCSTWYSLSGTSGGTLESHCEDDNDPLAYHKSVPDSPVSPSFDWRNVISLWLLALSFNTGVQNSNASTPRVVSQFVVTATGSAQLNPLMPSIAETLAVMASHTLLLSTQGSSFYHYWDFQSTILDPGKYLPFNASLTSQQYTSGTTQKWQSVFYIVLGLAFASNVFCLVHFFLRSGLVTDFTEPQNSFALAVNSPPSESLSGSCGAGPVGDQLNVDWHVIREDATGHFFVKDGWRRKVPEAPEGFELRRRTTQNLRSMTSYSKLSTKPKRGSWL